MGYEQRSDRKSICTNHLFDICLDSPNAMGCIELTQACNLRCQYCSQRPMAATHKSLVQVQREIVALVALSKSDTIVLTGGEPLLYPELDAAIQMVAAAGKKPVVLTNGMLLTKERLARFRAAGLFGLMFHVNARQDRPGFENYSEPQLNELRDFLARQAAEYQFHCSFNTLVFPSTLNEIHLVAKWASERANTVHLMTFVAARVFEATVAREEIATGERHSVFLSPYDGNLGGAILTSQDICEEIQRVYPQYRFAAFLGGSREAGLLKWAMGNHLCRAGEQLGNLGPTAVRLLQKAGKRLAGLDISHFTPKFSRSGWLLLWLAILDRETLRTFRRHVTTALRKPLELFRSLHLQTFIVMQSIDILPEGERSNCNGCSRMTTATDRGIQDSIDMGYVLRGPSQGKLPGGGSTQMQWPGFSSLPCSEDQIFPAGDDSSVSRLNN